MEKYVTIKESDLRSTLSLLVRAKSFLAVECKEKPTAKLENSLKFNALMLKGYLEDANT